MGAPTSPSKLKNQIYLRFVDPTDAEKVMELGLIYTGVDAPDGTRIYAIDVLSSQGLTTIIVAKTIGAVTFTGSGLDDLTNNGEFTGVEDRSFVVKIDATGTPDTFTWSKDGGVTWDATAVAITGTDQVLTEGVTVKFAATTGHTLADEWAFTTRFSDPQHIRKLVTPIFGLGLLGGGSSTGSELDCRGIESAVVTVEVVFDAAAIAGVTVDLYSSPDGVTWDTEPWVQDLEPVFSAGNTVQVSHNLDLLPAFIRATVVNLELVEAAAVGIKVTKLER